MKPPTINVNDALHGNMTVTFKTTGVRRAKFRIWCAKILIGIACAIINFKLQIKGDD
jgi:hypothetical protein